MTPQQLKNSILQLAVEGKLVEQRPEEGTGEALYQLIQEQKKELIEADKLKRPKALSEITETEIPFEIPITWKWVRLGDIIEIISSKRVHQSDWKKSGIPFYRAREISKLSEQGYVDNELFIDDALYRILSKYGVPNEGDLMISAVGTLGKTYIVKKTDKFYYKDASVLCLRNYAKLNSLFLKYIIESLLMKNQIKGNSSGTTVSTLTIVRMSNYIIPLPPLAEQNRIVKKIEKLLLLTDRYKRVWNKLEELNRKFPDDLRKSILQEALQGKICDQIDEDGSCKDIIEMINNEKQELIKTGQIKKEKLSSVILDEEIPFDIPNSWCWVRLKDIVYNRGQKKPEMEFSYIDIGSIDNINQKLTDLKKYTNKENIPSRARRIVDLGDILYSTVRPYLHNMCIVDKVDCCETIASTGFAAMTCYRGIYNKYLFYYLLSPSFDKYVNSAENSKGVAYPAINDKKFYKAVVPLAPLNEQKRIVEKIEAFFVLADRYKSLLMNANK